MTSSVATSFDCALSDEAAAARQQIRGSSLLFAGRLLAQLVKFGIHVLIVRYLSQTDYGAFAYALAVVKMGEHVNSFGLKRAVSRFVPIYHEQKEYGKLFGTVFMVVSTVLSLGSIMCLIVFLFADVISEQLISDQQAVGILLILVFLAPVEAIDKIMVRMLAVFGTPREIFVRRYVIGPILQLSVVALLISGKFGVRFLAGGYLAASAVGVLICTVVLLRAMRDRGLLEHWKRNSMVVPWKEVLLFTTPLLTTDLVYMLMNALNIVLLGYFGTTGDVAAFTVVLPVARLNQIVFTTFALLYTPQAARLFARDDRPGLNRLYWQTAAWIAVMTFPVFVLSFSLAQPLTVLLYGERYAESGVILALMSFGYYFNAALGFNGTTLSIYRKVGYIAVLNFVTALVNVAANFVLIPKYGAIGAAVATSGTLVVHNICKQSGLLLGTGINVFEWRYFRIYLGILLSAGLLMTAQWIGEFPFYISFVLAGIVFLLVVRMNRKLLHIETTFPELMRIPFVPRLLGK